MRSPAGIFLFAWILTSPGFPVRTVQQTATMQGTVTDLISGQPVPDAHLMLSGDIGVFRANSDSSGRFVVPEMLPGEYKVEVTRDGYYWSRSRSGPSVITIAGDLRNVSYRLLRGSVISGQILDHTGEPDSGVDVSVQRAEYRNGVRVLTRINLTNGVRVSTTTDRRGEYRLYGLPPGDYYLNAGAGETLTYYPGTGDLSSAVPLTIVPGRDFTGVNLTQVRSRTFTVTVEVAQAPEPLTISGGTVIPRDPLKTQESRASLRSIGSNRYVSSPIKPGEYELVWTAPTAGLSARIAFDIVDRDVDVGLLTLKQGITIQGRVSTPDSQMDLRGFQVRLNPVNSATPGTFGSAASDGSFSISNIPEGQYIVDLPTPSRIRNMYLQAVRYGSRSPERGDISVGNRSEGPLEIVLGPGSVVTGVVRNARRDVVPFSPVLLYPANGWQHPSFFKTVDADKNGAFVITGVAPRDYRVLAWEDALPSLYLDPKFLTSLDPYATTVTVRGDSSSSVDVRVVPTDR